MSRLKLHVTAGAREERIAGWRDGALRVRVRARPEKGRANDAVVKLLAGRLRLPHSAVNVVRGAASREKLLDVDGLSEDELRNRLA